VLSRSNDADELERLCRHSLELAEAALAANPNDQHLQEARALALQDQGLFFLETGRAPQAQAQLQDCLAIRKRLRAGGHMMHSYDRYVAINYAYLGRAQAAAGQTKEAEQSYQEALELLEGLAKVVPDSPYFRITLAETLGSLADLLRSANRPGEVVEVRR